MKRFTTMMAALLVLSAAPAMAMHHEQGGHGGHGGGASMGSMEHAGMMDAGTVMVGEQSVEGIKAMAHVRDVKAAMARMGMKETHHFMVNFVGKDGKPVTEGAVAVKIKEPSGKEREAAQLLGMQGHFGADVVLADKGSYEFKVGSKLPDGVTRQYEFKYEVK